MEFEWDPAKERSNRTKHGVSFEEVKELFAAGRDFLEIYDAEHSEDEDRFIAIGEIQRGVVVVSYAERSDETLRLVSARMATKREIRRFQDYWRGRHE